MMTEEQLAEIEARERAATKGSWTLRRGVNLSIRAGKCGERQVTYKQTCWSDTQKAVDENNFCFIANARADVPALIAEVRRLKGYESKAADDMLQDFEAAIIDRWDCNKAEFEEYNAKVRELRQALLRRLAPRKPVDYAALAREIASLPPTFGGETDGYAERIEAILRERL